MPAPESSIARYVPGAPLRRLVEGPSAWIGADMREREAEWTYRLSPLEIAEIETALRGVQARGLDIAEIRREDFPLPTLGPVLDRLRAEVLDGRGFGLLRGMPVEDRPIAESAMAYWGLALILGARVRKTRKGICWGMSTTSAKASARPILICGAMRPQNGRISTLIAATSLRFCVCGEQNRAGYPPSSVQCRCTMSWQHAGPICWNDCTSHFQLTGEARCRRARHRFTKRQCSTRTPAICQCYIHGCISVPRSGFRRCDGLLPKTSRRSICSPNWHAIPNCGST